jgi:hypothetical protein
MLFSSIGRIEWNPNVVFLISLILSESTCRFLDSSNRRRVRRSRSNDYEETGTYIKPYLRAYTTQKSVYTISCSCSCRRIFFFYRSRHYIYCRYLSSCPKMNDYDVVIVRKYDHVFIVCMMKFPNHILKKISKDIKCQAYPMY